jgi:hypothetical protein
VAAAQAYDEAVEANGNSTADNKYIDIYCKEDEDQVLFSIIRQNVLVVLWFCGSVVSRL